MKLTVLVLVLDLVTSSPLKVLGDENDVICNSPDCIATSERLLKNMNLSVDPCDDFYQFACGRFNAETEIPSDKSRWAIYHGLGEEINLQGRKLLEDEPSPDDFESYQLARDYYKSCTNEEKKEELGIKPILDKLKLFGGWPVVDGKKWQQEDSFKWWEWNYEMNRAGFGSSSLVSVGIGVDSKNTSWRVITIDQASLGLSREYLTNGFQDTEVQHYYKYMVDSAVLLGAESELALNELKESLLFEIKLANITIPKEERRNASVLYNPTTLGELPILEALPPSWVTYVQILFENADKVTIDDNEKIIITDLEYFNKLSNLLKNTKSRTLANYLAWQTVRSSLSSLNHAAHDIQHTYEKSTSGVQELPPQWKRCTNAIGFNNEVGLSSLGLVAGSMYVKNFVNQEMKNDMIEMLSYVRQAFKEDMLEKLDWMDDETKKKALEKLGSMDQFIAYGDEFLDKDKVDTFFKDINISQTHYFDNDLNLNKFWKTFKYNQLRDPIDPKSWLEHSDVSIVNAFYNGGANNIVLPAGILQGTFYNSNIPKYFNYGGIGAVFGHEITHGFDDKGKQRNKKGEIENWWEPSTEKSFKEKAQCIIDFYGNYTDSQVGLNLNGIANQGENIADIGGLKEAYKGYRRWIAKNQEEPMIVGLSYTPKQLFWVSFAQTWCTKYRDEKLKQQILTGVHPPSHFRVLGSVSNIEDFANDYNCPAGSKMNPKTRCSVW